MSEQKIQKKKSRLSAEVHIGGIPKLAIALSIRHLSLMLKSGLALGDSVRVLAEQAGDPRLREIYNEIADKIQSGMNLSDSMKEHRKVFSDIVISIVSVGEQGGTLEKNLAFLAEYLKKANDLNKKVKGALIYPGIVFSLTIFEMFGVIFFVLPKLEEMFKSFANIPPFTLAVLNISSFVRNNIAIILGGILGFIILLTLFLRTKPGKRFSDRFSLSFPVIKKLTQDNVLATFSRTLNILMESGIPLVRALEIATSTVGNSVYENILKKVYADVSSGKNLFESLAKYPKYFPHTFIKMIEIGESTGSLEVNLFYLYEYHVGNVEEMSTNLTTLLEPILLVFIGAIIGLLVIIIIGPIYQFTGSING